MLFKMKAGAGGRVIALDPDPCNLRCKTVNLNLFRRLTGLEIETVNSALWRNDAGGDFSADGCMGSSAVEYVGIRGDRLRIPSMTLDQLLAQHKVGVVGLLKCDIEGAEDKVFKDSALLRSKVKRMVVEIHNPPRRPHLARVDPPIGSSRIRMRTGRTIRRRPAPALCKQHEVVKGRICHAGICRICRYNRCGHMTRAHTTETGIHR